LNPYVDATTGVAYNKLGITDRKQLAAAEYRLTNLRGAELAASPAVGRFDLDHLRGIHRHLFQDVYEWAGRERTVNFSKRDVAERWWKSVFAGHELIPVIADSVNRDLVAWDFLKGLTPPDFVNKLTATYIKLNHMHPFPEGNGRSTQLFIKQLAGAAGYNIDYQKVDQKTWNVAAARSMPQTHFNDPTAQRAEDPRLIHAVFERIAAPTREKQLELDALAKTTPSPARRGLEPDR
jgi:cell filamentation protein